jgi:hypothetical protein
MSCSEPADKTPPAWAIAINTVCGLSKTMAPGFSTSPFPAHAAVLSLRD